MEDGRGRGRWAKEHGGHHAEAVAGTGPGDGPLAHAGPDQGSGPEGRPRPHRLVEQESPAPVRGGAARGQVPAEIPGGRRARRGRRAEAAGARAGTPARRRGYDGEETRRPLPGQEADVRQEAQHGQAGQGLSQDTVTRRRLDAELVRRGLARTRTEAQDAVRNGLVVVGGRPASKPSTLVRADEALQLAGPPRRFVSRGGDKLDAALERFGMDVAGRDALDAGASTGGFSDCLLQRGAARVVAVDVGYGQLAWDLRRDPRVTLLERTNVRDLVSSVLPFIPQVVVADLSFISLRLVLPALAGASMQGADLVLLVKPQFEAGPKDVGARGVVRDPRVWRRALEQVAAACEASGATPVQAMASPLLGPAGNVEFFIHAVKGGAAGARDLADAIDEGLRIGGGS